MSRRTRTLLCCQIVTSCIGSHELLVLLCRRVKQLKKQRAGFLVLATANGGQLEKKYGSFINLFWCIQTWHPAVLVQDCVCMFLIHDPLSHTPQEGATVLPTIFCDTIVKIIKLLTIVFHDCSVR